MQKITPLILAAGLLLTAARVPAQTPMHRTMPSKSSIAAVPVGQIIGNKKTHVFHVAGDHGSLPAPQNRVVFRSTTEAKAAGYRPAGTGTPKAGHAMNPERHGSLRTGTTSATGRPMPPHSLPGTAAPPPPPAPVPTR